MAGNPSRPRDLEHADVPVPEPEENTLSQEDAAREPRGGHRLPIILVIVTLIAGAAVAVPLRRYFSSYVSTTDAQINGHIVLINSRIAGFVTRVLVDDTWTVKQGQLLVEIDPRDVGLAVERARAALAEAQAQVKSAAAEAITAQARIKADQANYDKAEFDVPRLKALAARGAEPSENYYESERQAAVYLASINEDRAAARSAQMNVDYRRSAVLAAQAALDQALLNLSYTEIRTPVAGVVGNRTVQIGQQVSPGQGLMDITPLNHLWVTANFKETEFGQIRPGQSATIHVDALGRDLHGTVEGLGGATGALYSLLPPENATGNWIKVIQRLPVRIRLDSDPVSLSHLRPGQSVEVDVWLR